MLFAVRKYVWTISCECCCFTSLSGKLLLCVLTKWSGVVVLLRAWMQLISGEWMNVRSLRGEWMCILLVFWLCALFLLSEWILLHLAEDLFLFLFTCTCSSWYTYSLCAEIFVLILIAFFLAILKFLTFSWCGNVFIAFGKILLVLMCPLCSSETKGCQRMFSSADYPLGRILYACFLCFACLSLHELLFWDRLLSDFLLVLFSLEFVSGVLLLVRFVFAADPLAENLWLLVVLALLLAERLAVLLSFVVRYSSAAELIVMTEIR